MKYPLAMVNRLLKVYGDKYPKIGCACDIGCSFNATLHNSSLGRRAQELQF
jgi:hypothetical protein